MAGSIVNTADISHALIDPGLKMGDICLFPSSFRRFGQVEGARRRSSTALNRRRAGNFHNAGGWPEAKVYQGAASCPA